MKGLIKTGIIVAVFIMVGVGSSAIVASDLSSRVAIAQENGFEEGREWGYLDGFQEGMGVGYQEGSKIGYIEGDGGDYNSSNETDFYFNYNPTYNRMQEILAETEADSAKKIHDYAEASGVRVAYVRSPIAREAPEGMVYVYELVAFETVDKGFVIIEPWSREEIKVEVGRSYSELNNRPANPYDDTITKVTIVW
ncbi:hypothetical protein ACFLUJ_01695 [Chloroflexota bacterium]